MEPAESLKTLTAIWREFFSKSRAHLCIELNARRIEEEYRSAIFILFADWTEVDFVRICSMLALAWNAAPMKLFPASGPDEVREP